MTNGTLPIGAYDIFKEGLLHIMETRELSLEEAKYFAIASITPDPSGEDRIPLIEAAYQSLLDHLQTE